MSEQITGERLANVLDETADYLDSHYWIRHELTEDNGQGVCTVGAVLYSQGLMSSQPFDPTVLAVCWALVTALDLDLPDESTHLSTPASRVVNAVTTWNDEEAEGVQQVLDALRRTAKVTRAGFDPDA